jgi:ribosomal protein L32
MNAWSCGGKVRLASRRAAKRAGRSGSRLHAYFCKNCGGWHVGNTVAGPRRAPYKRERARVSVAGESEAW